MTAKTASKSSKPAASKPSPKTAPAAKPSKSDPKIKAALGALIVGTPSLKEPKSPAAKVPAKSPAAKTGDLVAQANAVLKRYSGNVEQATGEAGAQGDSKLAAAIKALGAPAPAAKEPTKAPKAAKDSKAPAAPGLAALGRKPEGAPRAAALPAEAKLVCLMKENPSRAGSTAFKVRELYRACKTVGEWRERVAASDLDPGYLVNDIRRGLVKVG